MGTRGEFIAVAKMYGREPTVVSQNLDLFAVAIIQEFRSEFLKLPDLQQLRANAADFMNLRGIPGVVGAMDGKHWETVMGADDEAAFKDFHGILAFVHFQVVFSVA